MSDEGDATGVVTVYTTVANAEEGKRLARELLDRRLVACASLVPLASLYWWKGSIVEEPEVALFLKTQRARLDEVLATVPSLHPYELPCVEVWPVDRLHEPFAKWVRDETKR